MAYFRCEFPDDILKQLTKGSSDETCRKMLKESIPILAESIRREIRSNHSDTGELANSIETFEPYKGKDDVWKASAAPSGKAKGQMKKGKVYARSKSGTMSSGQALYNSDKLWFLEYGTSKQTATPILKKAVNNAQDEVLEKMQETFNEVVEE